jgi:acyl-CoA synthetase (AMP-forming)/AMP-acid ligase II/acyl carrier protein
MERAKTTRCARRLEDDEPMTSPTADSYTTLAEALVARARESADQLAFRFVEPPGPDEDRPRRTSLTYGELDRRAAGVASALAESSTPGDRVLVLCEPGPHYIASLFGCFYAGLVAVPTYPPIAADQGERLRRLIGDCQPRLVLTSELLYGVYEAEGLAAFIRQAGASSVTVNDLGDGEFMADASLGRSDDVAMLQYTSGSTGSPRGVILSYRSLLANVRAIEERLQHRPEDRGVSWLPPYHDMGLIGGIFSSVVTGTMTVSISPLLFLKDPLLWLEYISEFEATISGGPNFAYELCVRKATPERLAGLDLSSWRIAVNGAEPVRSKTMSRFSDCFGPNGFDPAAFTPAYGLAEATLAVSMPQPGNGAAASVDRNGAGPAVPLGPPIAATTVAIVDPERLTRCQEGEVGEIWVDGPCVADGYWDKPGATAETFLARLDGDSEGRPFLRTGDLGVMREGELFVTGRLKDLIIIRGTNYYPQDIEETVGEVDQRLRPGCSAVFQLADGDVVIVQECAAPLAAEEAPPLAAKIRGRVASEHGIGLDGVVFIERGGSLKTSSGKIRRQPTREAYLQGKLPEVARVGFEGPPTAPGATPAAVADAFAEVLGVAPNSAEDDFFALGGDSLAAIELTVVLEERFSVRLDPTDVLRSPTPAAVAAMISGAERGDEAGGSRSQLSRVLREDIPRVERAPSYPLSPIQRRWAGDYLFDRSKTWGNLSLRIPLPDGGDPRALEQALAAVWDAHESLRSHFPEEDGELRQQIREEVELPFDVVDLGELDPAERPQAVAEAIRRDAGTVFDLARGPAARATLIRSDEATAELHVALHHMLADGWSVIRLREQIAAAYAELLGGAAKAVVPDPAVRYRDYSAWIGDLERTGALSESREYWLDQLDGDLPETLPVDDEVAKGQDTLGASVLAILPSDLDANLRSHAEKSRLSLTALLYAAFFQALHEKTGGRDLIVGTPLAGRDRPDLRDTVGMFINLVPVRLRIRRGWDFAEMAVATQDQLLGAMTHQHYQLDRMVEDLEIDREPHRFPITNTFFTKMEMGISLGHQIGARVASKMPIDVRFQLMMYAYEFTDGLVLECKYRDALFTPEEIDRLMSDNIEILERAC